MNKLELATKMPWRTEAFAVHVVNCRPPKPGRAPDRPEDLIEALAEIQHQQWAHWSQAVASEASAATQSKWQRSWVPYSELTEELKESDRVWARKVMNLLRERKLIL